MDYIQLAEELADFKTERFLRGIPRQCKHCGTWGRYKKPKKHKGCFSVECRSCYKQFEIVLNMKGGRK